MRILPGRPTWRWSPGERFAAAFGLPAAFTKWLDRTFKLGVHELRSGDIVLRRGWRRETLVSTRSIVAWRIHAEMGFDVVAIELEDGSTLHGIDLHDDLIDILRRIANDRERPWRFAR